MTTFERTLWQLLDLLLRALILVLEKLTGIHSPRAVKFEVSFDQPTLKPAIQIHAMITKQITNEQQVVVHFNPISAAGHPAPLDGPIVYEVLDGNSTFQDVSEDGKTATLRSEDGIGTTHYKATGDADLGAGFQEVSETIELIVVGPQAASFGATFDEPTLKT